MQISQQLWAPIHAHLESKRMHQCLNGPTGHTKEETDKKKIKKFKNQKEKKEEKSQITCP